MRTSVPEVPRGLRAVEGAPVPHAGYLRGDFSSQDTMVHTPVLRDMAEDVRRAWVQASAHTIDALQNNGWLAGGVEAAISSIIGDGLKLSAKPDHEALGMTASQAEIWAKKVERRYETRCENAYECDAGARYTSGQLEAAHLRQFFGTGEGVSQFLMIPRQGLKSETRVRLLPSHWLSNETNEFERLQQGVRLDKHGAPVSYKFRLKNKQGLTTESEYRARDRFGRPVIRHIFDGHAAQVRGITVLAPVIKRFRDFDQLTGSTLAASFLHAMFAATVESDYPTQDVLEALGGGQGGMWESFVDHRAAQKKVADIKLGSYGKIPHLFSGEKLHLHGAKYPNANYEPLANFLLREIARCLGVLFEDLTGDYRGATYSSLQNGIAKNWPISLYRRKHIAVPFKQADYEAWLEEQIDKGLIEFPSGLHGFLQNKDAACRAKWLGPAKPVADELKAARSDEIYWNMGSKSQGRIAADRGWDIDDELEAQEREQKIRKKRRLADPRERNSSAQERTDQAISDENEKENDDEVGKQ